MAKAVVEALKYINNPYALAAFFILIVGLIYIKIKSGNNSKTDNNKSNNISVSGKNHDLSNINQSVNERDDKE